MLAQHEPNKSSFLARSLSFPLLQATSRRFSLPPPDSPALLAGAGLCGTIRLGESRIRWVVYISSPIRVFLGRLGLVSSLAPATGGAVVVLAAVVFAVLDASVLGAKVSRNNLIPLLAIAYGAC